DTATSLRKAIEYANALPGASTITFDPSIFGTTPQTITLIHGELTLTAPATTTIDGPGAGLLTISGNNASRVFHIQGGSAALWGLTVSGGTPPAAGGGLYNQGGTITLAECVVTGNTASSGGGVYDAGGMTTLTSCTIRGNTATNQGGGLFDNSGTLSLAECTVSGNTATYFGGGLFHYAGTLSLTDCTVSGNSAYDGGGLFDSTG